MTKLSQESLNALRPLIDKEKTWFIENGWWTEDDNRRGAQARLVKAYVIVRNTTEDWVETLDRGNASRLTRYYAKQGAIEELVPGIEDIARTFVAMSAFADGINETLNTL